MQIVELTEAERLALVGLAKLVVRADKELSPAEVSALRDLSSQVGETEWKEALAEATRRFHTRSDAMFYAKNVLRPEARRVIYDAMVELAQKGTMGAEEKKVLDWIQELWALA